MLQTMQARSERCCDGGTKLDIVMDVTVGVGDRTEAETLSLSNR